MRKGFASVKIPFLPFKTACYKFICHYNIQHGECCNSNTILFNQIISVPLKWDELNN